jgi:hypothetical protein
MTMMTIKSILAAATALTLLLTGPAQAQSSQAPAAKPALSEHAKKDIERHRAMVKAHEDAARCLESGETEERCQKALLAACRGLAIGKYCGMKHEH